MDICSFFISLSQLATPVGLAWVTLIATAILFIGCVLFLVFNASGKNKKMNKAYAVFVLFILTVEMGITFLASEEVFSAKNTVTLVLLQGSGLSLIYYSVRLVIYLVLLISGRFKGRKTRTIDLRSFIPEKAMFEREEREDAPIERQSYAKDFFEAQTEEVPVSKIKSQPIETEKRKDTPADYSHVKGIIERLSFYELNSQERKLVGDLNLSVARAENGEDNLALKERISEGLGGLLKIMAKYNL